MSTWWTMARRSDLGQSADEEFGKPFPLTNRAWYFLYRFLNSLNARNIAVLADPEPFVPTVLANHWGSLITTADFGKWLQVGRWDGHAVVPTGIVHEKDAGPLRDTCELTPLYGTPMSGWLTNIGQDLASTPSGLVISPQPRRGSSMSVNLAKGAKVDLTKEAGGTLTKIRVGLGWDARKTTGDPFDLDASVVTLDENGLSIDPTWFVFYNNKKAPGDAIVHQGDELTGGKDGDDEQIVIDLDKLPANAVDLRVIVTIFEARARKGQSFSNVEKAFVRIINEDNGQELCRYDLSEDTEPGVNALVFAKIYRLNGAWAFKAIGDGFTDELEGLVNAYKI